MSMREKTAMYEILPEQYPERMRGLAGMPEKLYCMGRIPSDDRPSLAIVGARMCSSYGKNVAYEFARVLGGRGVQIISGMALGVDGAAHQGALAAGADTFAVLGSGADVCYPSANRKLYERLKEEGGILSEFGPGEKPLAWHFPGRNRLISALADAVLVVEARERSGSLITADCALEQGRTVLAVPGRAGDLLSEGCNRLISQGAAIAWRPEAVLEEMGWTWGKMEKSDFPGEIPGLGLASEDDLVYSCLDLDPKTVGQLQEETGLNTGSLMSALLHLELAGKAKEIWKNSYVRWHS